MKGFRQRVVRPIFLRRRGDTPRLYLFQSAADSHRKLSRAKDSNSSKKNKKESASGTLSPSPSTASTLVSSAASNHSPSSSNQGTPTSSTTNVNDTRNKPLPPGENGLSRGSQGNPVHQSPQTTPNAAPSGGPFVPSQPGHTSSGGPGGPGGPGTPTRHGSVPGVVISPSQGSATVGCLGLEILLYTPCLPPTWIMG